MLSFALGFLTAAVIFTFFATLGLRISDFLRAGIAWAKGQLGK